MNDNEKLANTAEEIREVLPETETQTITDSQQNTKSNKEDSSAESQKKPSARRKKAPTEKAEKNSAPDTAEKPEPKRKSTKKVKDSPAESLTEKETHEKAAEIELSEEASQENHEADSAFGNTENSAAEVADTTEEEPADNAHEETKDKELSDFEPALIISSDQFAWDLDDAEDLQNIKFVGERIIPPDELFANRSYPEKEAEELSNTDSEESEDISDEPEKDYENDENLDDDGQYTLGELELQNEMSEKAFTDEVMEKYDPKHPRKIDGRFDLVELFVFTLLAVMIVTTFFFRHSVVDGASMENTLHGGEHLIISDFFYSPKRGDVIVCEDYTTDVPKPIVKRVIAVAGDHIIVNENGEVFVNGTLLEEDYVFMDGVGMKYDIDEIVGEGEIFVMGDHRNVSLDSRKIGTISVDSVLGKVLLRFYPFDKFGTVD